MGKNRKYRIKVKGRMVEISEANSSILAYRIPYPDLLHKDAELFEIKNPFIVYILFGENREGMDVIYVGKSKNGIKNRPTAHEDKYNNWTRCYILTQLSERTFFNDGTIQYIEDKLNKRVSELNHYLNTTQKTTEGTANESDKEDCSDYLEMAYDILDVLGLDLNTHLSDEDEEVSDESENMSDVLCIPEGIYTLKKKRKIWGGKYAEGRMQVSHGTCTVLEGSVICPIEGIGLYDAVRQKRETAKIEDNILKEPIAFKSPSGAAMFVTGASANGWAEWRTDEGKAINIFKNEEN